uniref:Uncharacterized protein n=1 Tax=Arundo donax TaxID=35708 RepID=A0A0A8YC05_ARUDO
MSDVKRNIARKLSTLLETP